MWILEGLPVLSTQVSMTPAASLAAGGTPAFWLLAGTHSMGRPPKSGPGADLLVTGDSSISKVQATLTVAATSAAQVADVTSRQDISIIDQSSYGTFVNEARCSKQEAQPLKDGDIVRFANRIQYRVTYRPGVLYVNPDSAKDVAAQLVQLACAAGAHVVRTWTEDVTHVLLEEDGEVDAAVAFAMLNSVPLVEMAWLVQLCSAPRWPDADVPRWEDYQTQRGRLTVAGGTAPLLVGLHDGRTGRTATLSHTSLRGYSLVFHPTLQGTSSMLQRCVPLVGGKLLDAKAPRPQLLSAPAVLVGAPDAAETPGSFQGLPLVTPEQLVVVIVTGSAKSLQQAVDAFRAKQATTAAPSRPPAAPAAPAPAAQVAGEAISDDTTQEKEDKDGGGEPEVGTRGAGGMLDLPGTMPIADSGDLPLAVVAGVVAAETAMAAAADAVAGAAGVGTGGGMGANGNKTKKTKKGAKKAGKVMPKNVLSNLLRSLMDDEDEDGVPDTVADVVEEAEEEDGEEEEEESDDEGEPAAAVRRAAAPAAAITAPITSHAVPPAVPPLPPVAQPSPVVGVASRGRSHDEAAAHHAGQAVAPGGASNAAPEGGAGGKRKRPPPAPSPQPPPPSTRKSRRTSGANAHTDDLAEADQAAGGPVAAPAGAAASHAATAAAAACGPEFPVPTLVVKDEFTQAEFVEADLIRPHPLTLLPGQQQQQQQAGASGSSSDGLPNFKTFRKARVAGGNSTSVTGSLVALAVVDGSQASLDTDAFLRQEKDRARDKRLGDEVWALPTGKAATKKR